ncbi:hypothetical protein ACJ73_04678 [Blastomyces percursus]|uniref:Phospholipid/glycerol acyltransferase domain-containing protein n=1 Tax=Blastomyces percursus TaxID=1658174 RepID=A0A1J9Q7B9_9EURO|nr:hypothetical protein ACJ73_04678 [Blastomyces percursus]
MDGVSGKVLGHVHQRPAANYGLTIQILRSLALLTWFNCCCVCIVATQLVGSPLYFINRQYFNSYMAMTKRSFGIAITALTEWGCPTPIRVSGDKSVQGQFSLTKDGNVKTSFPERMVLIANHQVYTDWLYLWWFSYTSQMHGHIYIILKESLKYIPLIGQGMMFYGFIFMARKWISDKPRLQHRLEKLKAVHGEGRSGPRVLDPMWLLIFPEGTNLSRNTKRISDAYGAKQGIPPLRHQILPRSTGLFFCLQQLMGTVDWVYDCTVGYEGPPKGSYPDAYFTIRSTYLKGRPPKVVNFYWRRFAIAEIPLDDQKEFEAWIHKRWIEKDDLLELFYETGRFPPCEWESSSNGDLQKQNEDGASVTPNNPSYYESAVKLSWWGESLQIFAVLVGLGAFFCLFPRYWRFGA